MKRRIFVLDDTCKSNFGGTALTLKAILEQFNDTEVFFIETRELNQSVFDKTSVEDIWVIGNTFAINAESFKILSVILLQRRFIKIEFDYGFCNYRCEQGFKHFTGIDKWEPFGDKGSNVLRNIYDLSHRFAKKIFYMSKKQMELHNKKLEGFPIDKSKQVVLGSCFCVKDLMIMMQKYQDAQRKTTKTYAIIDGNGGWHSKAKGVKEAILYAKGNNLPFKIIHEKDYYRFLDILSGYYGLIFLPQIHDTCPRVTIEAKLMGLDLITNENSQHATEEWFALEGDSLANYLLDRPTLFKKEISGILE